jgi:hypothetical protein
MSAFEFWEIALVYLEAVHNAFIEQERSETKKTVGRAAAQPLARRIPSGLIYQSRAQSRLNADPIVWPGHVL